jgi:hypothetical protein
MGRPVTSSVQGDIDLKHVHGAERCVIASSVGMPSSRMTLETGIAI